MSRRLPTLLWIIPALTIAGGLGQAASAAQQVPATPAPAEALPPPSGDPGQPPPVPTPPAPRDGQTRPAAGLEPGIDDGNPLPEATRRPGATAPAPAAQGADPRDGYTPAIDRLATGLQTVGVSVEVVAPGVMNLNREAIIKILVKNTGAVDANTVRVKYDLPRELELVSAQPKEERIASEPMLIWPINTLAAGSEQIITLKVKPIEVSTIDHAALVTLMVGSKSRTVIQQPLLKVEVPPTTAKVLKGKQVKFRISVSNPGSGPARNVVVTARLSSGLKADGEQLVEQTIPIIQPKETVTLEELIADTIAGGEQTCTVEATSPDVGQPLKESRVTTSVTVLKPDLTMTLAGPETRYTDTMAEYRLTVENPGSADAKNIKVTVTLPANSGRLQNPLPFGAVWNSSSHTFTYTIANLLPKGKSTGTFRVRLGGVGLYRVAAEARAPGELAATARTSTDVSGMADIDLNITERKRVLDVGETTIFDVRIKNIGTKDAKNLQIRAFLSKNILPDKTAGIDGVDEVPYNNQTGELVFPQIDSLAPGRQIDLSILVKALEPGAAVCKVTLYHDDLADPKDRLEDKTQARVMGPSGTKVK
jgi:uncharacterized repeat protein (TIGR01451 family)